MAGEWRDIALGDVADLVRGVSYRPNDLLADGTKGIPLLRATNIRNRALDLADVLFVPPELVRDHQRLRRFDVVIAMSSGSRDAVGRLAQLRRDWTGCVGAFCGVIRADPKRVHPEYVGYVLQSPEFRTRIETHAVGTAIMNLSRERILGFSLQLPDLREQRAIGHILGTLDDKIELNRRMSETLEAMARALFKSWFVDFDPVRAKAEGRDPGLPQPLADLFPARLVDSELGEIPEGWEVGTLGHVLVQSVDRCTQSEETRSRPYVPIECIATRSLLLAESKPGEEAQSSLTRFRKGELLFGAMRPYFHKVAIAPFDGTTRTTVFVLRPRQSDNFSFVTLVLHDARTIEYATNHSTGSTIPYAVWQGSLETMPIVLPPAAVRNSFEHAVRPLLDRIPPVFFANRTLAALRDALLPKLISGELRVKDAEKVLERAGV